MSTLGTIGLLAPLCVGTKKCKKTCHLNGHVKIEMCKLYVALDVCYMVIDNRKYIDCITIEDAIN